MNESNITVKIVNYQRNGISGQGFYTAILSDEDNPTAAFLATFSVKHERCESLSTIDVETFRVINLHDLTDCWRGDRMGSIVNAIVVTKLANINAAKGIYCNEDRCSCEGRSATIYDLIGLTM